MRSKHWGGLKAYMMWPLFLSILSVASAIGVSILSPKIGIIAWVSAILMVLISVLCYVFYRNRIMRELVSFGSNYAQIQKQLLNEMAVPYGMIDENCRLLWRNREFALLLGTDAQVGKSMQRVFSTLGPMMLPKTEEPLTLHLEYGKLRLKAEVHRLLVHGALEMLVPDNTASTASLYALYLFDETEISTYQKQLEEQKPVVGLIYLDNYEEALEGIEEVRRSLLVALIDRKINKYITSMGGILKKIEKDKYLVVLIRRHLTQMQDQKFHLLDEVKTVNIGNEMAVTISMGLGTSGDTYYDNYQYARTAIDMALARGGDQVVLKERGTITYYGGKTQTMEKNTRVKARVKAQALRELIESKEKVLIMGHQLSDADSIGAAVGMYRAAKYSGRRAHIILNTATASIRPLLDRFADNPDYEEDLFINNDRAMELVDNTTVLIIVDVNRPTYTECPELLSRTPHIVVLDHHRQTREIIENAVLSYVEPYASSASEMVAEILQYYGDNVRLKALDADAIYAGIVIDTNNFLNKTGIRTFEAAAFLRRNGADVVRVRKLFREEMDAYKAKAEAVRNAQIYQQSFAISHCGQVTSESPTIIAAQAANELLSIRGVKASFVMADLDGTIYISARSIDEVNVQVIMERLGGGGHMTVAGAQLKDTSLEAARTLLEDTLSQMLENKEI